MVLLKCNRKIKATGRVCGNSWEYNGKNRTKATCGDCHGLVVIPMEEKKLPRPQPIKTTTTKKPIKAAAPEETIPTAISDLVK